LRFNELGHHIKCSDIYYENNKPNQWVLSHIDIPQTVIPFLLCSLVGMKEELLIYTHFNKQPTIKRKIDYEFDYNNKHLLIELDTNTSLIKFSLNCNYINYHQECFIHVLKHENEIKKKEDEKKSIISKLLINSYYLCIFIEKIVINILYLVITFCLPVLVIRFLLYIVIKKIY
jgi:hypothetical protein